VLISVSLSQFPCNLDSIHASLLGFQSVESPVCSPIKVSLR
jgi:hypothetical protein